MESEGDPSRFPPNTHPLPVRSLRSLLTTLAGCRRPSRTPCPSPTARLCTRPQTTSQVCPRSTTSARLTSCSTGPRSRASSGKGPSDPLRSGLSHPSRRADLLPLLLLWVGFVGGNAQGARQAQTAPRTSSTVRRLDGRSQGDPRPRKHRYTFSRSLFPRRISSRRVLTTLALVSL